MASWTVWIFSASSSGISMSNSSSSAITSSTVSRESAPRSSMNDASATTSSSLTPSCSTMISFTRFSTEGDAMVLSVLLLHVHAAVDVDHLARHVRRVRAREERHRPRHVLGLTEPPERDLPEQILLDLVGQRPRHVRLDEARRDRVDEDPSPGVLARARLREADEPGLRGDVVRLP